jgi:hypothetical protein
MRNQSYATAEALATSARGSKKWCEFCERSTHHTDQCCLKKSKKKGNAKRRRDDTPEDTSRDSICFYCGLPGDRVPKCPVKQRAIATRLQRLRKTNGGKTEKEGRTENPESSF